MLVKCFQCDKQFDKKTAEVKRTNKHFCDTLCYKTWRNKMTKKSASCETLCKNCSKSTKNPKFCNKSCAAIYNNKKVPKRKRKQYHCRHCGTEIPSRRTTCSDCNPSIVDWSIRTIRDCLMLNSKHANKYRRIRDHARYSYNNSNRPRNCEKCSYDKHYEVCHIKPIRLFDLCTPISVVNTLSNLITLCPNCHWELDNGLITMPDYRLS